MWDSPSMTGFELLASLVGDIVWPAVVVLALLAFRKQLGGLIPRLKSARAPGGWEADFGQQAEEAKDEAQSAVTDIPEAPQGPAGSIGSEEARLNVPRDEDPTFAVIVAWERVSNAVDDLAQAIPLKMKPYVSRNPTLLVQGLMDAGYVNGHFVESVTRLRRLRNLVAHGHTTVSRDDAEAYVEASNELVRAAGAIAAHVAYRPPEAGRGPGHTEVTS